MQCSHAGLTGIRLSHDDSPSPAVTASLIALRDRLNSKFPKGLTDCVLGYRTLTVFLILPSSLERLYLAQLVTWTANWASHRIRANTQAGPLSCPFGMPRNHVKTYRLLPSAAGYPWLQLSSCIPALHIMPMPRVLRRVFVIWVKSRNNWKCHV